LFECGARGNDLVGEKEEKRGPPHMGGGRETFFTCKSTSRKDEKWEEPSLKHGSRDLEKKETQTI